MIIYHPRNDLYHCMFRFISIASMQDLEDFDSVRLRIYDLFYLFPHLVKDIEFPRAKGIAELKRSFGSINQPYEVLPDKKRLFSEMGDYHIQALQILKAKGIFEEENGNLRISEGFYSPSIQKLINDNSNESKELFCKLFQTLNAIQVVGEGGLKKRTGLMEYRYDAV
ncbi:TPA: hypothetical protein NJ348_003254 [Vibrio parahaemolyticus]|nr:hypothetical protein [Vibrio parahaemolyticus]EKZ9012028.1 hypothetical protein [Vibrio alginolyticus]EJC6804968.1 hypothetical protein [Vibrio parahaemolyticus]EJG1623344.1 hypothetical protein [Vibrio parahaemolyticus]EKG9682452.1 hypothetical protein [Vibrio parahaemolyticus]